MTKLININLNSFLLKKLTASVHTLVNQLEYYNSQLTEFCPISLNSFLPTKVPQLVNISLNSNPINITQNLRQVEVCANELISQLNFFRLKPTKLPLQTYLIISHFHLITTNINSVKSDLVINQELVSIPINNSMISKIN